MESGAAARRRARKRWSAVALHVFVCGGRALRTLALETSKKDAVLRVPWTAENGGCDPAARHPRPADAAAALPPPAHPQICARARARAPNPAAGRKSPSSRPAALAPCLSSAVGFLIEKYTARNPSIEIICYIWATRACPEVNKGD